MKRTRTNRSRIASRSFVVPHLDGGSAFVIRRQDRLKAELRTGFTLIEMLVAVTLVLLMMVMFGEIFQVATNSVTKQRTMADNDQNARTFVTVLRADLDKRSFRSLIPFFPGELSANPGTPFTSRKGYLYIANNNIASGADDVLQFTVLSTVSLRNSDESPYYGRAVPLYTAAVVGAGQQNYNFLQNPNQPDRDDGQVISNNAAASKAGEVSYWMRGGRLYRRVMLLRDPIAAAGKSRDPIQAAQPSNAAGADLFAPTFVPTYAGNFWGDFDFSAHRMPASLSAILGLPVNARFNGLDYLANDLPPSNSPNPFAYSLGQTWNRFGHNHEIVAGSTLNGLSREFSSGTAPNFFLGRFTEEETSNTAFLYPQALSTVGTGNPMDATPAANALTDTPEDGVVDQFAGGPRAGVDMLLSHVHEFRVEAWDERIGDFAVIGHTIGAGDFHTARQLNPLYAPVGGTTNSFDTWHPQFNRNFNIDSVGQPILSDDLPPFRAMNYYPPTLPGPNAPYWTTNTSYTTEDANGNGVLDGGEDTNGNGVLDASRVFPLLDEDVNFNNAFDVGEDTNTNGVFDRGRAPFKPFGHTLVYRCLKNGTSAPAIAGEQNWPLTPGQIIRGNAADIDVNGNGVVDPGDTDYNGDGAIGLAEPDWVCEYNLRPLRAIRVTVRFEHPTSKQMKQITIVHSLRDTTAVP